MKRPGLVRTLRGAAVAGGVVALALTGATTASAADAPGTSGTTVSRQDTSARHLTQAAGGYRGTQGFNLCLLSTCSTGSEDRGGNGVGLVQGGNLCLLSTCELRP
ncbi:hypothetical protein [Streptomyces zingiberis]|uniref:Secreted protein n=1 Tax=Streptomyces zingiberis TaxID=2053010 RepID=A0ABX1BYJ1_9ACTN|nr:hypothetical protein [Streptomyces zingiberis]NJP99733.1 hypothetical protein [Streptomyces zingiberis]